MRRFRQKPAINDCSEYQQSLAFLSRATTTSLKQPPDRMPFKTVSGRLATACIHWNAHSKPDAQGAAAKVSFAARYSPVARPAFGQERTNGNACFKSRRIHTEELCAR